MSCSSCYYNCCNISGYCASSYSTCYYYSGSITSTTASVVLSTGAIIGIVVGIVCFVALIAGLSYWRRRKIMERAMLAQQQRGLNNTTVVMQAQPMNPQFGQPYGQPNPMNYNPMMQQPPMGNPLMY